MVGRPRRGIGESRCVKPSAAPFESQTVSWSWQITERGKRVPRYDGCVPGSSTASKAKRRNRRRDTSPELLLRRRLWARGIRYRLCVRDLPGKPDIVIRKHRVAIFVDGDFWHGRNWKDRRRRLEQGANPDYWIAKIEYNIRRDKQQTAQLQDQGWRVLRFWEREIASDPDQAVERVVAELALEGACAK